MLSSSLEDWLLPKKARMDRPSSLLEWCSEPTPEWEFWCTSSLQLLNYCQMYCRMTPSFVATYKRLLFG